MIYAVIVLAIVVLYVGTGVTKLNNNFVSWAVRDIRHRGLK